MKYEYKFIPNPAMSHIAELERDMNEEGQKGWELCCVAWNCFIFKRQIKRSKKNAKNDPLR